MGEPPDPAPEPVAWRHSLVLRLFALVAVVALVAVATAVWLTVRVTAVDLRETRGEALEADARIADAVTAYAATHPDWSGAGGLLRRLAARDGERVAVTDLRGRVLADSSDGWTPLPGRPSAVIDPLDVGPPAPPESGAAPGSCVAELVCAAPASYVGPPPAGSPVDDRAVGPFAADADAATRTRALAELQTDLDACLRRADGPVVTLTADLGWRQRTPRTTAGDEAVEECRTRARRTQLTAYVAPAALLQVSRPGQEAGTFLDLSSRNRAQIAGAVALALVAALGCAAVVGRRLVRPLGDLTDAAHRMHDGDLAARARVRGRDEVARVAGAVNAMAARRQHEDRLRRALVGDVAHELRNPISTVRGTLEAAQDGLVPVDTALVDTLLEETLLLQHVVEDLRDLAAADAGELRLVLGPVPTDALVDQVVAAHRQHAEAAGVRLLSRHDDPAPTVVGDALRLRQLLGNLVSNALRHTPTGGEVVVSVEPGPEAGAVALRVSDTGEGIGAADLTRVFDRFWRADPSRTRASGGSGLGLAIVRQLAVSHGGTVEAASEPGAGSVFTVRLPGAG